jgi:dihydroneopterin aldolase
VTDAITIEGLRIYARHGVFEHEAESGQLFIVDLTIETDLAEAGQTDDLAATLDYGRIADQVARVVSTERWQLIERVAARVAETVLADQRCRRVHVTVHKPDAPIRVPFEDVSVTVVRP